MMPCPQTLLKLGQKESLRVDFIESERGKWRFLGYLGGDKVVVRWKIFILGTSSRFVFEHNLKNVKLDSSIATTFKLTKYSQDNLKICHES